MLRSFAGSVAGTWRVMGQVCEIMSNERTCCVNLSAGCADMTPRCQSCAVFQGAQQLVGDMRESSSEQVSTASQLPGNCKDRCFVPYLLTPLEVSFALDIAPCRFTLCGCEQSRRTWRQFKIEVLFLPFFYFCLVFVWTRRCCCCRQERTRFALCTRTALTERVHLRSIRRPT